MIKRISPKFAVRTITFLLLGILAYHTLIIVGVIPFDMVWGGRLQNKTEMFRFETFSIGINLLLLIIVSIKGAILKIRASNRVVNTILWIFTAVLAINTFGNLFSKNIWETIIFTPLTLILSILCARLALHKGKVQNSLKP